MTKIIKPQQKTHLDINSNNTNAIIQVKIINIKRALCRWNRGLGAGVR